jgi:Sigma-70, region 4
LRQLPRRQREALALRFFADMNEAEIAEAMGISRGTVKSAISRGISSLGTSVTPPHHRLVMSDASGTCQMIASPVSSTPSARKRHRASSGDLDLINAVSRNAARVG